MRSGTCLHPQRGRSGARLHPQRGWPGAHLHPQRGWSVAPLHPQRGQSGAHPHPQRGQSGARLHPQRGWSGARPPPPEPSSGEARAGTQSPQPHPGPCFPPGCLRYGRGSPATHCVTSGRVLSLSGPVAGASVYPSLREERECAGSHRLRQRTLQNLSCQPHPPLPGTLQAEGHLRQGLRKSTQPSSSRLR